MGGQAMTAIDTDGASTEQELPRKKLSGKRIVLFIVLPLILIIGGAAGLIFTGVLDSLLGKGEEQAEEHAEPARPPYTGPPVFTNTIEMLVNLTTTDRRPSFLKLGIKLELSHPEDLPAIEPLMPRITDTFQVYLRELRREDLSGSAGMFRLQEELRMRVNAAASPVVVKDVLLQDFLIQ